MINSITCTSCKHQTVITSPYIIFCKHCSKKFKNNFIDWKKNNSGLSFKNYVDSETQLIQLNELNVINKTEKKQYTFKKLFQFNFTEKQKLITSVMVFVFSFFIAYDFSDAIIKCENKKTEFVLESITWQKHTINSDLIIDLPFCVKKCESNVAPYLQCYLSNTKSFKSQSSNSFSVTIEEIELSNTFHISEKEFLNIKDEFMNSQLTARNFKNDLIYTTINSYKTTIETGSYNIADDSYNYENYTLKKDTKVIKVIISYLANNKALQNCALIVTNSIYRNALTN